MAEINRRKSVAVNIGGVLVGGGHAVVVQSMTNTDTADACATAQQVIELARAGSELVRITVNTRAAAAKVAEIVTRVRDAGFNTPVVGDFHYNGHLLLAEFKDCARALAIKEKIFAADNAEIALSLNNLAVLYQAQGRNDEAAALLRRALVIFESALGDNHPHLLACRENLADLG